MIGYQIWYEHSMRIVHADGSAMPLGPGWRCLGGPVFETEAEARAIADCYRTMNRSLKAVGYARVSAPLKMIDYRDMWPA